MHITLMYYCYLKPTCLIVNLELYKTGFIFYSLFDRGYRLLVRWLDFFKSEHDSSSNYQKNLLKTTHRLANEFVIWCN